MNWELLQNGLVITLNVASMLAMGLALPLSQIGDTLTGYRDMSIGVGLNLVAVPLLAWALVWGGNLPAAVALGFLLCAAAPGGNTGPLFTANAQGDTAYAVGLVLLLSFASVLTVPLTLDLFVGALGAADVTVPLGTVVLLILAFQIAPLCAGMAVHRIHSMLAERFAPRVRLIANLSLALLTVLLMVRKGDLLLANGWLPLVLMEVFVLALIASGLLLGSFRRPRSKALSMTTCTRNLSLALLLGAQVFEHPATMIAILGYGLLWIASAVPVSLWMRRLA